MEVSPGGNYIQCKYCDYRKKLKRKDRTSINVSYVNNSYHDNRKYKYTDNTGKWDVLKEFFHSEVGFITVLFGLPLFFLFIVFPAYLMISDYLDRDERAAREAARIAEEQAYEEYVMSVPHNTVPITTTDAIGANYEDIISMYENAGFTNVSAVKTTPEKLSDKVKTPNNSVMNLTIDGDVVYDSSKNFPLDVPIAVYYYNKW